MRRPVRVIGVIRARTEHVTGGVSRSGATHHCYNVNGPNATKAGSRSLLGGVAGEGAVRTEERAELLRVEFGLLERREVPAARGLGHAHDVRRALEPRPRRADDVAGEQREAG